MSGCSEFHLFLSEPDEASRSSRSRREVMERLSGSGKRREAWHHAAEVQMQEQRRESAGTPAASTEKATESLAAEQRLTWTVPEVARLLGISKDSAYEAAHRGELPVRVIGRRMLVPRAALLRLLDGSHAPEQTQQP